MKSQLNFFTSQLIALLSVLGLTGCNSSQNLNPPKNGESVQVSINVPDGFTAHDIKVIYRSKTCIRSGTSLATGKKITRDGYQDLTITPELQVESNLYTAKVPVDGGGRCKWKLSNLVIDVGYTNTNEFGPDISKGSSAEIIVRYDEHRPYKSGGRELNIEGDVAISADYYPWFHERFISGHQKSINLYGAYGDYMSVYAPQARKIQFEPKVHSDFIVYSKGYKEKMIGRHPVFTYPDGSMQPETFVHPNFQKLQSIRLKAEQSQQ